MYLSDFRLSVELLCPIVAIAELDQSQSGGSGYSITIGGAANILDDCHIGDSICVNGELVIFATPKHVLTLRYFLSGACLTVTEFDTKAHGGSFKIGAAPETLRRTDLGSLKVGDKVNCERAMAAHTRFGGHCVQGHVDTMAQLLSVAPTGNALTLTLQLVYNPDRLPTPSSLEPYLIPKGYVTLDGTSLTLIDVSPAGGGALTAQQRNLSNSSFSSDPSGSKDVPGREVVQFTVMLIAHTQEIINLPSKKTGDFINVEFDMAGKYVCRSVLSAIKSGSGAPGPQQQGSSDPAGKESAVDAARAQSQDAAPQGDALERMVEKIVRKVLAEKST